MATKKVSKKAVKKAAKKAAKKVSKKATYTKGGIKKQPKTLASQPGKITKYYEGVHLDWLKYIESGMTMEEAAHAVGVLDETVRAWAKKYPSMREAKKRGAEIIKARYIKGGCNGSIPTGMALGLLKMQFGFMEEDKRQSLSYKGQELAMKREELDARINGTLASDNAPVVIQFTEKTQRDK